jgi:hypothetical protein
MVREDVYVIVMPLFVSVWVVEGSGLGWNVQSKISWAVASALKKKETTRTAIAQPRDRRCIGNPSEDGNG